VRRELGPELAATTQLRGGEGRDERYQESGAGEDAGRDKGRVKG
jgi:hypothetical protein